MRHFLLACSLIGALGVSAQTFMVDGINYKVVDADASTVSVEKKSPAYTGSVVIPSTVTNDNITYTVVAITQSTTASTTDGAFANCTGLTAVTLPETLVSIGNYSFNYCTSLTSLTIPQSVKTFGDGAFLYCSGLTSLVLPERAERLGINVFKNCNKLQSITIPEGITTLSKNAIQSMGALETVHLPSTLTEIADGNFQACPMIKTIKIPEGVTKIGANFAYQCSALKQVDLPSTLTAIGNYCFWNSKIVTAINCAATTPPTLPSGAFYGWNNEGLYAKCTLYVPESSIGAYKTADIWKNFTNVDILLPPPAEIGTTFTIGGVTYIVRDNTERLSVAVTTFNDESGEGGTYSGAMTIPATVTYEGRDYTVTEIGVGAFYSCKELTSISLPSTIEKISEYAFSRCEGLKTINPIPASVTSIDPRAFAYTALQSISVEDGNRNYEAESDILYALGSNGKRESVIVCAPGSVGDKTVSDGVTSIGYAAFANGQLSAITLPSTLATIGEYAFDSCLRINTLNIPENVTEIGAHAFYKCEYLSAITLPAKLTALEEGTFMFCRSIAEINIPATVTTVGPYVFESCTSLTGITLPDGCNFLGDHAFEGCTALTSVTLPQTLKTIDKFAFINCSALTSVTLPKEMELIGYGAFKDCSDIEEVNLPEKLTTLEGYAFGNCDKLTSMVLPEGLTAISDRLFWECNMLTDVNIPSTVTTIGEYAFSNTGITEIDLHEGVTTICGYAFQKCAKIVKIAIPSTVTSIGEYAFWNCSSVATFTSHATVPPTAPKAFNSGFPLTTCKLFVPQSSLDSYREAEGWMKFTNIAGLPEVGYTFSQDGITYRVTVISEDGCEVEVISGETPYTGDVVIPATVSDCYDYTVTAIADNAFADCTGLTSVTIPATVKTIGSKAFKGCTGLVTITCLGSTPAVVEADAFEGLALLEITLNVPDDAREAYMNADVWKDFFAAGIEDIIYMIENGQPVYDLYGRQVSKGQTPNANGIYIVKGRKFIVR